MRQPIPGQGGKLAGRWETAWVVFSPDARVLIAAGQENAVLLYDPQTGKLNNTLRGHSSPINCVGFSGDGQAAASGDEAGTAIVWDVWTGQLRKKVEPGHGPIWSVALNPDGTLLAVGHADGAIALANLGTEDLPRIITAAGHVGSLGFSPDGHRLLVGSGGTSNGVREIEVDSGKTRQTLDPNNNWCQFPRYSPDGSTIACGYWSGNVSLWDATTGASRFESPSHGTVLRSVAASPDGSLLAAGENDGNVVVWNLKTGTQVQKKSFGSWPKTLAFASEPNRLFVALNSGSGTRTVGFWDLSTGRFKQSLQVAGSDYSLPGAVLAPDGSFVVSVDEKHAISVWELNGRERLILRSHTAEVAAVAVSPDGRLIAWLDVMSGFASGTHGREMSCGR